METILLDIILLALVFWAGYNWGKRVAVLRIITSIARDPEYLGRALDDFRAVRRDVTEQRSELSEITVERHGDQIYVYDSEDREFLAQGENLEQALDRVQKRFPERNYSGHLTREQLEALGIKL